MFEQVITMARRRRVCGYRQIYKRLRRNGVEVNHKKVERICRQYRLTVVVPKRVRRKLEPVVKVALPTQANQTWSTDFLSDRLPDGRQIRIINCIDLYTRECLAIEVGRSMTARRVVEVMDKIVAVRGLPQMIVTDNGPEFIAHHFESWAKRNEVTLHHITPGRPTENAFIERLNGTLRRECLELNFVDNLREAAAVLKEWRHDYNHHRPHSSLKDLTPKEFAKANQWVPIRMKTDGEAA